MNVGIVADDLLGFLPLVYTNEYIPVRNLIHVRIATRGFAVLATSLHITELTLVRSHMNVRIVADDLHELVISGRTHEYIPVRSLIHVRIATRDVDVLVTSLNISELTLVRSHMNVRSVPVDLQMFLVFGATHVFFIWERRKRNLMHAHIATRDLTFLVSSSSIYELTLVRSPMNVRIVTDDLRKFLV
jgi:hypothetical protein